VSLAVAAWWDGTRGVWVACADAALIACGIVGCFAYVTLVSAQASAAGRLRVLEHQGPERRVGVDRRKTPVSLPAAIERRSGIDRRATPTPVWSG
jgi:hypothetical protein